jgi:hypothetical protein
VVAGGFKQILLNAYKIFSATYKNLNNLAGISVMTRYCRTFYAMAGGSFLFQKYSRCLLPCPSPDFIFIPWGEEAISTGISYKP